MLADVSPTCRPALARLGLWDYREPAVLGSFRIYIAVQEV
jgi:hypothetical protein